jgi:hypothetical protein
MLSEFIKQFRYCKICEIETKLVINCCHGKYQPLVSDNPLYFHSEYDVKYVDNKIEYSCYRNKVIIDPSGLVFNKSSNESKDVVLEFESRCDNCRSELKSNLCKIGRGKSTNFSLRKERYFIDNFMMELDNEKYLIYKIPLTKLFTIDKFDFSSAKELRTKIDILRTFT